MLGIGLGGSAEKAMVLAKEALMAPIDMHELLARGPANQLEELRIELYEKVNALGIGAQGLGGLSTVLDVKILDYPTHAASMPVAHDSQLRRDPSRALHARRLAAPPSSIRPIFRNGRTCTGRRRRRRAASTSIR